MVLKGAEKVKEFKGIWGNAGMLEWWKDGGRRRQETEVSRQ
jgi:hypothetical protein